MTIGFDIGGTNLRGAVVDDQGTIVELAQVPTPGTAAAMERAIENIVHKLANQYSVSGVGLAVAGFLDPDCATVRFAPHLPWRDTNVRQLLTDRLGLPVTLEHDANAAAWGEYRFGAAQGARIWSLIAIGTGIGGALMIDGKLYRGAFGTAPEFGHLQVVANGRECPCGKRGCLERYCSGTALVTQAKETLAAAVDAQNSALHPTYQADPDSLTGRLIMQCARRGDPIARQIVDTFATWLGSGLALVADVLDPELIVIGGGVAAAADLFYDRAHDTFTTMITGSGHRPYARIETTTLGGDAGMIGVADLARNQQTTS
ncbi:ROK family protein [Corynebacterium choanae]|uniref:Glucokinase n=1 Tax=Corynebacterium choanae TaxID=1862358 RepID=A0A3G6JAM1_9CORY|nr:ROK family protein [Corynebacterium choanae]AZA13968.1 Glucokinase [Corynebacterium choanae]